MNGKKIVAHVNDANAKDVDAGGFVADGKRPSLVEWDLSMATGELKLSFDETVKVASLDVTRDIFLHNQNLFGFESVEVGDTVVGHTYTTSGNGPVIVVQLADADLNAIKTETALCTTKSEVGTDCRLRIGSQAQPPVLTDMNNNVVNTVPGEGVTNFQEDDKEPTLVDWALSMDKPGVLSLTFSEVVNPVLDTSMLLFQWKGDDDTHLRRLSGGTSSVEVSTVVTV